MRDVNVEGAVAIARACREAKVPRLIHVSCMRAFPDAVSEYSRSKVGGGLHAVTASLMTRCP